MKLTHEENFKNLSCIHTIEYYSAIIRTELLSFIFLIIRDEFSDKCTWINPEYIMLSKESQSQRTICCMTSFI